MHKSAPAALLLLVASAVAGAAEPSAAAPAPAAAAPASRPATQPFVLPPGFVRVSISPDVEVFCEPGDEGWVREALAHVEPATRPTTMPADLLSRLTAARAGLAARMAADTLAPKAAAEAFIDRKLIPAVRELTVNRAHLVYLVTTLDKTKALLRGGWENPQLRYNRLSDQFQYVPRLDLAPNGAVAAPSLILGIYPPELAVPERAALLRKTARSVDQATQGYLSTRGMEVLLIAFTQFVRDELAGKLGLKEDQQWFDAGVMGELSVKYAAPVTGVPRAQLLGVLTRTPPNFPVNADRLDLLHPTRLEDLRAEYKPYYLDALRRRGTLAVDSWLARAGDDALPKVIAAIKTAPPADSPALAKLIADTTGVDLTTALSPR